MPRRHHTPKAIADQEIYHLVHPKKCYGSVKEAQEALKAIKKYNLDSHNNYVNSNSNLRIYFTGDLNCYQIGHRQSY